MDYKLLENAPLFKDVPPEEINVMLQCGGTEEERYQLAADFGALLSYPEEGIRRLIEKTREARR